MKSYKAEDRVVPRRSPAERRTATSAILYVAEWFRRLGYKPTPKKGSIYLDKDFHVVAEAAFGYPAGATLVACYDEAVKECEAGKLNRVPLAVVLRRDAALRTRALVAVDMDAFSELLTWANAARAQAKAQAAKPRAAPKSRPRTPASLAEGRSKFQA